MLAHEHLRALSLVRFDRTHHAAVMVLRDREYGLRLRQIRLHDHERAGGGEWKGHDACNLPGKDRAVGELDDDAVELPFSST